MYRAMQIANYVVHLAIKNSTDVTNLHLQKILYYLQGQRLLHEGTPLFNEDIEKWRLGPVVPEVYHEYKRYGSQPIEKVETEIFFDHEKFELEFMEFNENDIDAETKGKITGYIIRLLNKDPFTLVDLTHDHAPWKDLKERIESGEKGLKYSLPELHDFFTKNPEKLNDVLEGE